jgi:gluconate kinase
VVVNWIPLNDLDRIPCLRALRDELRRLLTEGRSVILACSALKEPYRQLLSDDVAAMSFVCWMLIRKLSAKDCSTAPPISFRKS